MTSAPAQEFDLLRVRQQTPGCRQRIHLNNAGAASVHYYNSEDEVTRFLESVESLS